MAVEILYIVYRGVRGTADIRGETIIEQINALKRILSNNQFTSTSFNKKNINKTDKQTNKKTHNAIYAGSQTLCFYQL